LGYFFTNASGHPALDLDKVFCVNFVRFGVMKCGIHQMPLHITTLSQNELKGSPDRPSDAIPASKEKL
jgi:hypothetical protein